MSGAGRPSYLVKEMYNENLKRRFLTEVYPNEGTRRMVEYLFYRSKNTEDYLEKDIYSFNIDNLSTLIKSLNPMSRGAIRSNVSYLKNYMYWAADNGYRPVVDLPLEHISQEWIDSFLPEFQIFFSKSEIDEILNGTVNYQDKALICLLFEGANGVAMSEITNLTEDDIDWNNRLIYLKCSKHGKRKNPLKVSERCIQYLKCALYEEEYSTKNGMDRVTSFRESSYVMKNLVGGRTVNHTPISRSTASLRLNDIKETLNLNNFTPSNIVRSGMIYEAYKLYQIYDDNFFEYYKPILEKFNVKSSNIKDYINVENIIDLYGEELNS